LERGGFSEEVENMDVDKGKKEKKREEQRDSKLRMREEQLADESIEIGTQLLVDLANHRLDSIQAAVDVLAINIKPVGDIERRKSDFWDMAEARARSRRYVDSLSGIRSEKESMNRFCGRLIEQMRRLREARKGKGSKGAVPYDC
jgi:hypothetical protein